MTQRARENARAPLPRNELESAIFNAGAALAPSRSFAAHRSVVIVAALAATLLNGRSVIADPTPPPMPRLDMNTVFLVAKSENKNQVHFGVHVDQQCNVVGANPLYGYWRMLEKKGEIEPILSREVRAYGIDPVQKIEKSGDTTTITTRLNAIPDRLLRIRITRTPSGCGAEATMPIAGGDARLRLIYVRIGWMFSVDYILLRGSRMPDGHTVEEKI